jgi:hypothetical protein
VREDWQGLNKNKVISFLLMSKNTTVSCHLITEAGLIVYGIFYANDVPGKQQPFEEIHNFL